MPAIAPKTLDTWTPGTAPAALVGARVVLVHGGDEGGVGALAADLVRGEGPAHRMAADGLSPADLGARLSTGGLFGAPSPVRVSGASDKHVGLFEKALALSTGMALLVVEAGALKKDSKLKALFEAKGHAVELRALNAAESGACLARACAALGTPTDPSALRAAQERLPNDRMRLTRMAEVLTLHAIGRGSDKVEAIDIEATIGFESPVDLTQALMAALSGDLRGAVRALDTQLGSGENPIALLRAWSWKLQRVDDMLRSNLAPAAAVAAAKPPVFFTERDLHTRLLGRLGAPGITALLTDLDATEQGIVHKAWNPRIAMERWMLKTVAVVQKGR